ncbi:hypothetical protein PFISCL1PPCAC_15621, partial [Pristionchus fissidentatus]
LFEACERCLPPITFINPRMTVKSRLIETECTLYIFDNNDFVAQLKHLVRLVQTQPRTMNIIVVNGDDEIVGNINNHLNTQARRSGGSNSNSQRTPTSSMRTPTTPSGNASPARARIEFDVGVADVHIKSAIYKKHQGGTVWDDYSTVDAVLLRVINGSFIDQRALTDFTREMEMEGEINIACLRLLTFDPNRGVKDTKMNPIYFEGSSYEAMAVAARCACNRIQVPASMTSGTKDQLRTMQKSLGDDWKKAYEIYASKYTPDGKPTSLLSKSKRDKAKKKLSPMESQPPISQLSLSTDQ